VPAPGIGGFAAFRVAPAFIGSVMAPTASCCITDTCGADLAGWMAHRHRGHGGLASTAIRSGRRPVKHTGARSGG
jgi:hypothetical protein